MENTDNTKLPFTSFPNYLYDAILAQKLTGSQIKALLYIIRKTVGFRKEDDEISISRMANDVGYTRRAMINAVQDLEKMGIVRRGTIRSGKITSMCITDPENWDQPPH